MPLRLGDRLKRLNPGARKHSEEPQQALPEPAADVPGELRLLRPWIRLPTPYGGCLTHREETPCPAPVAVPRLERLLGDERLRGFDPDRALYLDIEATGLSHGAGTFAFLIGCAYVRDGRVVLEQLLMADPTEEMPVLGRFLELLDEHDSLVSFNGKSYDLSVLQARLVITRLMSRIEVDLKVRPHLDLLHVSNGAYRGVYDNCRLQTLEREVLRLDPAERADDVPGSMVPALYFHYLATGNARHLHPVLVHNRTDVTSMVTLTRHLLDLMRSPEDHTEDPRVLYNLGRAALRRGLNERAARLFGAAVEGDGVSYDLRHHALVERVTASRRAGDMAGALEAARAARDHVVTSDVEERERLARQIGRFEKAIARPGTTDCAARLAPSPAEDD